MLSGVCFGTNDLDRAVAFYDAVLPIIGLTRTMKDDVEAGYGLEGETPVFWVLIPFNREPATFGNGTQAMFRVEDQALVDAFHEKVLALGGTDEGAPGPRSYSEGYYGAYCRDHDGNKLHVAVVPG